MTITTIDTSEAEMHRVRSLAIATALSALVSSTATAQVGGVAAGITGAVSGTAGRGGAGLGGATSIVGGVGAAGNAAGGLGATAGGSLDAAAMADRMADEQRGALLAGITLTVEQTTRVNAALAEYRDRVHAATVETSGEARGRASEGAEDRKRVAQADERLRGRIRGTLDAEQRERFDANVSAAASASASASEGSTQPRSQR
jgi:hypothetical protein